MVSSGSNMNANIDAYALFEALTGRKIDRRSGSSTMEDWDKLRDLRIEDDNDDNDRNRREGREPREDEAPKDINVGAINPYALVEALIGRRLDRNSIGAAKIMSDVLQTDYDELFDMKNESVLYAGLRLNREQRRAEHLEEKDVKILEERDLATPDLSRVTRLRDLENIGLKNMGEASVKMARLQNGKLRLVVDAHRVARTLSNHEVTERLNNLTLPYRRGNNGDRRRWQPPNGDWREYYEGFLQNGGRQLIQNVERFRIGANGMCEPSHKFDDPVQGATANSWLVAAIFSVFWANPCMINRGTRIMACGNGGNSREESRRRMLAIKLHDKGGCNNNKTAVVEVDYEIPINNSSNDPMYCRSSDGIEIWPALYEKAFAMWITNDLQNQHPDITQTHHGDPIKAMCQMTDKTPHYYKCENHSAQDLAGLVRANSVNYQTISPMCAWTHATAGCARGEGRDDDDRRDDGDDNNNPGNGNGDDEERRRRRMCRERDIFRGANIVANHAYSVLGWTARGDRQYIILRNPWGVTEPQGLTSYPGLIERVEPEFWRPACLLDRQGVLALEASAFREYFACVGVAK